MDNDDKELQALVENYLRNKMGISLEDVSKGKQELEQTRAEKSYNNLRKKWGLNPFSDDDNKEFQRRIDLIKGEFEKLADEEKVVFNSPTGAAVLWDKIKPVEPEHLPTGIQPSEHKFISTKVAPLPATQPESQQPVYTRDDIRSGKVSNAEIKKNWNDIVQAYQSGQVH